MPRLSEAQHAERALGLGASDVATLAGVNPWNTPFELYLEKIGELDPDARIDDAARGRFERGHRLEDVALQWDADISGEPVERVNRTVWHPRLPFLYCHPDGRRRPWSKTRTLVEVKTSNKKWTEVPRHVQAQCQAQMACTGAIKVDVVVLGFDGPPTRLLVERDDELIMALEGLATTFWDRVQRRDPPPVDGSAGASRWLDRLPPGEGQEAAATHEQSRLLDRLLAVRLDIKALGEEDARLVNQLKEGMLVLGVSRLRAKGIGSVLWTAPTTYRNPKWSVIAGEYRHLVDRVLDKAPDALGLGLDPWNAVAAIESIHTTVKEGVRSFRPSVEGEDQND